VDAPPAACLTAHTPAALPACRHAATAPSCRAALVATVHYHTPPDSHAPCPCTPPSPPATCPHTVQPHTCTRLCATPLHCLPHCTLIPYLLPHHTTLTTHCHPYLPLPLFPHLPTFHCLHLRCTSTTAATARLPPSGQIKFLPVQFCPALRYLPAVPARCRTLRATYRRARLRAGSRAYLPTACRACCTCAHHACVCTFARTPRTHAGSLRFRIHHFRAAPTAAPFAHALLYAAAHTTATPATNAPVTHGARGSPCQPGSAVPSRLPGLTRGARRYAISRVLTLP